MTFLSKVLAAAALVFLLAFDGWADVRVIVGTAPSHQRIQIEANGDTLWAPIPPERAHVMHTVYTVGSDTTKIWINDEMTWLPDVEFQVPAPEPAFPLNKTITISVRALVKNRRDEWFTAGEWSSYTFDNTAASPDTIWLSPGDVLHLRVIE